MAVRDILLVVCLCLLVVVPASAVAASYDATFALTMVHYSAAAYCPATTLQSWTCACSLTPGFNVTRVAEVSSKNLQGFVGYDKTSNAIVVGFRGTQATSLKNWITNLDGFHSTTTYPHCASCAAEAGFYSAHEALKPLIVPEVHFLKRQHPNAKVYITGHSLGAALAVLSAAHLQSQEGVNVDEVYVFGLPRVGNVEFSKWFNGIIPQAVHVVHYHDIVPHLPPEDFGYHHVPTEVWYDEETGPQYKICDGKGEDPTCSDSVHFYDYSVSDHLYYLGYHITQCDSS